MPTVDENDAHHLLVEICEQQRQTARTLKTLVGIGCALVFVGLAIFVALAAEAGYVLWFIHANTR